MIERFTVSRDDALYHAWPDVTLTRGRRLVCVFSECTHHGNRDYTRIMLCDSDDRGRTWSPKRPLSEPLRYADQPGPIKLHWNCARIVTLRDGRLAVVADRVGGPAEGSDGGDQSNFLWFSDDEGRTWSGPVGTPVRGIVPDQLIELRNGPHAGRWLLSAHTVLPGEKPRAWAERVWISDDRGQSWRGPIVIAASQELKLCEGSIVELPGGELACLMRENSGQGYDAYKAISRDAGETWSAISRFPLPGCHRPVAGMLASGRVLVTYRFMQGGKGWLGAWTQNFFAALTDVESMLAEQRNGARVRIMPIDYDRSSVSDLGYSGWVQFDDGEIYIVNYIVDDAPKAQIRGYALRESDFLIGG